MSISLTRVRLHAPYLMFVGDECDPAYAKASLGIVQWRREQVAGQLRLSPDAVSLGVPDMDIAAAVTAGVASLVIGVAPVGGVIPDAWWRVIIAAASAGLDVVSGLHCRLADRPDLAAAARRSGARLVDVRVPPVGMPVGSGICCVGVSVNTSGLPEAGRRSYLEALGDTVDVPCIDPLVDGCDSIVRLMLKKV